ncbi:MAG: hypothetical protein HFJ20_00095 [Clostridia bacterium]|nr:hypothetical protein [Clostridia bacterium]
MSKSGIVNVRMVITEEKILSNIDKIQKLINPKSKKQIVQLEEDTMFKDLVQSIKDYLTEYPNKKNFPNSVYKSAYGLVEYATNQFEENTKKIEELIIQRENNIALAAKLKKALNMVINKEPDWKNKIQKLSENFSEEIIDTLGSIGRARSKKSQNFQDGVKLINAKVANLESNLHIEIDMERIEDRSKALSFIGIEIAEALKEIPVPEEQENIQEVQQENSLDEQYINETRVNIKPSLWERFKNTKLIRAIRYVMKIKVVLELPEALPEPTHGEH